MQPTDQATEAAQTRPETTIERLATLFQRVRNGQLTPYDAAERALSVVQQAPSPLPPPPSKAPEQEQAGGVSTTSLPPPPSFTLRSLLYWPFRRPFPACLSSPAGSITVGDEVLVLCSDEDILHSVRVTALWHSGRVAGRRNADDALVTIEVREVVEVP